MKSTEWYVHLQGQVLGPFNTETVSLMLTQNRLQFADFIWRKNLSKWNRVYDLDEFQDQLPTYPKISIPNEADEKSSKAKNLEEEVEKPSKSSKTGQAINKVLRRVNLEKSARVKIKATLTCEQGTFKVVNIGESGVFVQSSRPLPLGTSIQFKLESSEFEKNLEMTGVVIRHGETSSGAGFAVEFTRVNPAYKRMITNYVLENSENEE